MINKIINSYKLRIIKGSKILNKKNKKLEIENLKDEFSSEKINSFPSDCELQLRQFLIRYLINFRFNAAYYKAVFDKNNFIYPLPKVWSKKLQKKGFKINSNLNSFLLYIFSIFFFLKSFKTFFVLILYSNNNFSFKNYISFIDLNSKSLPINREESYDIFSWYRKEFKKDIHFLVDFKFQKNEITQNYNIYQSQVIFPPLNIFKKIKYFLLFLKFIISKLFYLITFNWEKIILAEEEVKKIYVSQINKKKLAKEYWFSISNFIFRPLWTYEIENSSKIILYNYSSSFLGHKINGIYPPEEAGIKSLNWPHIYQWSDKYLNFLKNKISKSCSLKLVSPIWYSDKNLNLILDKDKLTVSVFDVAPSNFMRSIILNSNSYRTNYCAKKFLLDIVDVIQNFKNIEIFFKTKRILNSKYHSKVYINLIENLKKIEGVNFIDGECSPFRLIKNTDLNISIPFTSTALIGNYMNKPSCFYDPLNILDQDDRASQDIKIVKGKNNLHEWFKKYV